MCRYCVATFAGCRRRLENSGRFRPDVELSGDAAERPRMLVVGISGASNYRGKNGKQPGSNGEDEIIKGLINDFDRIALKDRTDN